MNPLIERYVYDVIRRLPEAEREEVRAELLGNIEAMLPKDPKEEDVIRVLDSLGSPSKMAEQYRTKKRYLISPAMFDDYLHILKLVAFILFMITLIASTIGVIVNQSQTPDVIELIAAIVATVIKCAFTAAVSAFVWVTVSFALVDHFDRRKHEKNWTVKELPQMPRKVKKIPRKSVMVSMVFSVIFNALWILVMLRYSQYIAWYEGSKPAVALFNEAILKSMVPFMIALAMASLLVSVVKLIYGYWSFPLAFVNTAFNIANVVFVVYFFNYSGVFNKEILAKLANMVHTTLANVTIWVDKGLLVLTILIIFGTLWDIGEGFYKAYKNMDSV